jgi:hypothetical protein
MNSWKQIRAILLLPGMVPAVIPALIVYAGDECYRVDEQTITLPWNSLRVESGREES